MLIDVVNDRQLFQHADCFLLVGAFDGLQAEKKQPAHDKKNGAHGSKSSPDLFGNRHLCNILHVAAGVCGASKTSRTLRASAEGVNGFCNSDTPLFNTP